MSSHGKSTTQGQQHFAQIPKAEIQRSAFNRSCGLKTTFDAGNLVPIFCDEVLPGDTLNLKTSTFARMATQLHPIMDNMFLDMFYFAVPMRLIWDNWERFNGAQTNPDDTTDYLVPTMTAPVGGYANSSLSDYIGIPTLVPGLEHSSMWHRAYNLIYNEWFRDENLQDSVVVDRDDGPDDPADYVIKKRGKRQDYFTSCLPWPQKGDPVSIPLGTDAPVTITGNGTPTFEALGATGGQLFNLESQGAGGGDNIIGSTNITGTPPFEMAWNTPQLTGVADLSAATAQTINQLRQAFQLQRLIERDARGGSRYTEIVRSHFGVVSPDQRLQRPEYLGGGTSHVNVNPVADTSGLAGGSEIGSLGAFATSSSNGSGFTKSFTEHCVIIGLVSMRADLSYQQGLQRMFSRSTRFDFYWPAFAHLGEQAVLNKEILAQGTDDLVEDENVFGYQERFAEYRYKPSQITGEMRSNFTYSLDTWHLAQDFATVPALNGSFIEENPPVDRVLAVSGSPQYLFDAYFQLKHARPMPTYSVPGLIDHF